ncbi:hypothetical protein C8Q76DRAFT_832661 [Earliella scabrosa]|nr:hypothetical protein C8Q76DRAFT_832661 [Earliella scabrosa]
MDVPLHNLFIACAALALICLLFLVLIPTRLPTIVSPSNVLLQLVSPRRRADDGASNRYRTCLPRFSSAASGALDGHRSPSQQQARWGAAPKAARDVAVAERDGAGMASVKHAAITLPTHCTADDQTKVLVDALELALATTKRLEAIIQRQEREIAQKDRVIAGCDDTIAELVSASRLRLAASTSVESKSRSVELAAVEENIANLKRQLEKREDEIGCCCQAQAVQERHILRIRLNDCFVQCPTCSHPPRSHTTHNQL